MEKIGLELTNGKKLGIYKLPLTVTRDLGIWLNLKMVLYLENLCIMEKIRIFNPKPLVAPGRQAVKKLTQKEKQFGYLSEKNFIQPILKGSF